MVSTPGEDGALGRYEFVAACEALLADTPGCANAADLHELFDILDPQCTGQVSLQEFSRLLQAYRQVPKAVDGHTAAVRLLEEQRGISRPEPGPGLVLSPLAGLRAWMLQHAWIFQDLEALLGDPTAELDWSEFARRLLSRVRTPWLTRQGVADIFAQLQVRASNSPPGQMQPVVRVPDLVQALLGSEDFALEAARRVLRVVAREARHRGQDVGKLCLAADTKRVGSLNLQQLSSVLSSLCPGMLAEADVGLLFWRFSGGGGFSYEQLEVALKAERNAAAEHLLLRALPVLIDKAAEFEAASKVHDTGRTGRLSAAQLRGALSKLNLFAGDMTELDEFIQLLAESCQRDASNFAYATLVTGGTWKGPSVKEAIARVCGEPGDAPPVGKPAKRHLLSILYYKTAEASKKLGLSRQRAFEGMDRGNKGFLNAEDLRAAVLQVVGGDETLTLKDLGLPPATRLTFPDFEKRLNFDFGQLSQRINEVFGDQGVIAESDFIGRLSQLAGIDKATSETWIQLMYPEGLPAEGISRGACEIFLATTPASPAEGGAVPAVRPGPELRAELMKDAEAAGIAGRLPAWVAVPRARSLLRSRMSEKDADQILQAIVEASAKYPPPGPEEVVAGTTPGKTESAVRSETLLLCVERAKAVEHVLEVSFKSIEGFEKAAEVFLRYNCHGTGYVADVPFQPVDFKATHVFSLSAPDSLSPLFEGRDHALTIQAWIAVTKGELRRPLAVAVLPAADVRDFLKASVLQKPRPEAVLGSQKKWTLDFSALPVDPKLKKPPPAAISGSLELMLHYRRRPLQDPQRSPLPWSSSFAGRLVVCRKGVASAGLNDPEEAPSGLGPREEEPPPKPPAGSVILQVTLSGLVLQADALRGLVARCLQGQLLAAPGSVGGLASKAPQLFLRLCLFPGKAKMQVAGCGGWAESSIKPVPEMLLVPSKGDAKVTFDFTWTSPALEATQAVEALQDGTLTMEVWIRHPAADLRLSEKTLKLQGLLEAVSPEDTSELRLRTLQPAKLEIAATFERDGKALASLLPGSMVELQLPNGPGTLSWLLEKPKIPKVEETPMRANYSVSLREIMLSADFVAHLAGHEDMRAFQPQEMPERLLREETSRWNQHKAKAELPLFYLEMIQGDSQFRSAPVPGRLDGGRWLRIQPGEDTVLPLPGRFVVNGGPPGEETRKRDAALLRGDRHKVTLRLLQIGAAGTKVAASADAQLPIGWFVEGVPAAYFGGHQWVPLLHVSPERPWTSVIGRALLRLQADRPQADRPGAAERLLRQVPVAPAGLFLPLYKDWQAAKSPSEPPPFPRQWHLEMAIKLIAGEELWKRLSSAESSINAIPSGSFQSILRSAAEQLPSVLFSSPASPNADSSAARMATLQEDLAFLSASVAPMMADAEILVPTRQLLLWMSLRCLARWTLPVAEGLVQRLSYIDFGEERGQRASAEASGAVALTTFQTVLQAELRQAGLPDLPAALWQLISQRTEWQAGGQWHFDYLLFLWDLQAACGGESMPGLRSVAPPLPPPHVPNRGSLMLTIHQAFHLPVGENFGPPSAFVSYAWRCERGLDREPFSAGVGPGPGGLGSTKVVERSTSPAWNHVVVLDLPEVTCGESILAYPEAFRHLYLELWVWHAGRTQSEDILIGGSEVPLVPLKSGYEVDGYFHILEAEDLQQRRELDVFRSGSRGQLRVTVAVMDRQPESRERPAASEAASPRRDAWPFRCTPGQRESSPPRRPPVLTMDPPSWRTGRPWSPVVSPKASGWQGRPWEPPLPETWGCPRGPLAEQLWKLGLRNDRSEIPGVENDVSETALRAASKLSDTELQLRSLVGDEEEQLRQLRARHQQNLESLGMLQKSMLLPAPDTLPRDVDPPPADASALQDLVAASAATLGFSPGIAGLNAGPLPRADDFPSEVARSAGPFRGETELETAGPLPPPSLAEDALPATQGRFELEHRCASGLGTPEEMTAAPLSTRV